MKLNSVTVQLFRNFVEAQTVAIEPDVTVLVGKNESGKTTLLKALHRLNPANLTDVEFDLTTEYPRWRLARDRKANPALDKTCPVQAGFAMESDDIAAVAGHLPVPPPAGSECRLWRRYDNTLLVGLRANFKTVVKACAASASVASQDLEPLMNAANLDAAVQKAKEAAKALKEDGEATLRAKALTNFASGAGNYGYLLDNSVLADEALAALQSRIPKFFYFSMYDSLPGECDLTELAGKAIDAIEPEERTVLALLAHAGETPQDFLDEDYDSRKAELQAASVDLSRHVFEYWRQNTDLTVVFDTDNVKLEDGTNHRILKIEIRDARHGDVETNFETRSTGFQWFFSFFAAFSEYQDSPEPIIVLLDEPGMSLHGEAQQDFVRYVSEELAPKKQTLYTTHSQFMVDPARYEKLRAVHDRATREDPGNGVEVTLISLSADKDTVLPVESALGYSISQHLFIGGGQHLLVEGSSDFIYLQRMTEHLLSAGGEGLDPRLAILPVGGADNMPAFVALLGHRLGVSALIDGAKSNRTYERVKAAAEANEVPVTSLVVCRDADDGLPTEADIEDLFAVGDYLRLYNWAFDAAVTEDQLPEGTGRILTRLESVVGAFDHALPAHALTRHRVEFFQGIDAVSVSCFTRLFELLNATVRAD
jgi:energy-coupling factor transporter ATP-binding protein EcfA2